MEVVGRWAGGERTLGHGGAQRGHGNQMGKPARRLGLRGEGTGKWEVGVEGREGSLLLVRHSGTSPAGYGPQVHRLTGIFRSSDCSMGKRGREMGRGPVPYEAVGE